MINASRQLVANPAKSHFSYGDYKSFFGIRIGIVASGEDWLSVLREVRSYGSEHGFDPEIVSFRSEEECETALISGKVDAILLTGGMAYWPYLRDEIKRRVQWVAPVHVYPGEDELEALAGNALAVLRGEQKAQEYK